MITKLSRLIVLGIVFAAVLTQPAVAATDLVNVYFLPIQEAATVARSQLSDSGKVAMVPSQHILIIDDDTPHIHKAKALLKRLDRAPGQFTAFIIMEDISATASKLAQASAQVHAGKVAGGWLQMNFQSSLQSSKSQSSHRQSFQLRISNNEPGSIVAGTIQGVNRSTRVWLSGYGVLQATSVSLVPVTSGFHITVTPAGSDKLRVRIVPWMQRTQARISGQQEMLLNLGNSNQPATPPGSVAAMRLNAQPVVQQQPVIEIVGAATEVIIPVDQSVTIAAANSEAEQLGDALLSRFSRIGKRQFVMHLRVIKN